MPEAPVLLFDGHCAVCNAWVRFVLEHEAAPRLRFAPLQSDWAARRLASHDITAADVDTVYLIDADGVHCYSDAVVRVAATLRWPWRALGWLRWLPRPLRDAGYRGFGAVRYRLFGRADYCASARLAADRFVSEALPPSGGVRLDIPSGSGAGKHTTTTRIS